MKNILIAATIMVAASLNACAQPVNTSNIIPLPVSVTLSPGKFYSLHDPLTIGTVTGETKDIATVLASKITAPTGYKCIIQQKGDIQLTINNPRNGIIGDEGYTMGITTDGISIQANTTAGLFYGIQSLLQLLPKEIESKTRTKAEWKIAAQSITDYPRFAWRGMMLDVSRHFFTVDEVKQYIDNMSRYKYNVFHWHLTDDHGWRIQIKALPRLTEVGACRVPRTRATGKFNEFPWPKDGEAATDCGYYTQEQIKDVIAYAKARHIQVMPEIDVPGHSAAAVAAFPELSCTKNPKAFVNPGSKVSEWYGNGKFKILIDNTLNPSDERVYRFLDTVFTEVAALFPYQYIHAGGDECYHGYWEQDTGCIKLMREKGLKTTDELQSYFVKRVEKIISSKGKKLIGWDEILQGGLAPEATVMSWQGVNGGIEAAKQGHYVVMTPNQNVYIDLPQGDISVEPDVLTYGTVRLKTAYQFEPVPDGIDSKYILGGQANLWTEKVYDMKHGEYMAFPRTWALADVYWSPKESCNWGVFVNRMENQMQRADVAGIQYARSAYDAIVAPRMADSKLVVALSTEIDGLDLYYTLGDTEMKKYSSPFDIPAGTSVLRVNTRKAGREIGKTITLTRAELVKRAKR